MVWILKAASLADRVLLALMPYSLLGGKVGRV